MLIAPRPVKQTCPYLDPSFTLRLQYMTLIPRYNDIHVALSLPCIPGLYCLEMDAPPR
jgi:hypothetical protein